MARQRRLMRSEHRGAQSANRLGYQKKIKRASRLSALAGSEEGLLSAIPARFKEMQMSEMIPQARGNTSRKVVTDAATARAIAKGRKKVRKFDTKGKPVKKAKAAKSAKPKATRGDGPSGRVAEILKLASRAQGVSREELNKLTKWKGAPWRWLFSNPRKNGYADRWGYRLRVEEGKAGEARYCVTAKR
jgi:hypothetical protein